MNKDGFEWESLKEQCLEYHCEKSEPERHDCIDWNLNLMRTSFLKNYIESALKLERESYKGRLWRQIENVWVRFSNFVVHSWKIAWLNQFQLVLLSLSHWISSSSHWTYSCWWSRCSLKTFRARGKVLCYNFTF